MAVDIPVDLHYACKGEMAVILGIQDYHDVSYLDVGRLVLPLRVGPKASG